MKIIAFIPARYDSTRFPGKPLAMISGRPMIQHVYRCASACSQVSEVFVATDDQRISESVHAFGGKVIMTSRDLPSGTDRIAEAITGMDLRHEDVIINIQGDQPFFHPSVITHLIAPFMENPALSMGTLKYRLQEQREAENPNNVKVVTDNEGFALYFSRSLIPFFRDADSPRVYYKHLGFYAYRPEFLMQFARLSPGTMESAEKLEQLRALEHGFRIKVVETFYDSIEVDTPRDIENVEEVLQRQGFLKE